MEYCYQATDSQTNEVYTWQAVSPDPEGTAYPGPNDPENILQTNEPIDSDELATLSGSAVVVSSVSGRRVRRHRRYSTSEAGETITIAMNAANATATIAGGQVFNIYLNAATTPGNSYHIEVLHDGAQPGDEIDIVIYAIAGAVFSIVDEAGGISGSASWSTQNESGSRWCLYFDGQDNRWYMRIHPHQLRIGAVVSEGIAATSQISWSFDGQVSIPTVSLTGYVDVDGKLDQSANVAGLTYETYRDTPATYYYMRHDQDDSVTCKFLMPGNWDYSAVTPHLRTVPMSVTTTGNIVIDGYYTWSRAGYLPLAALSGWTAFSITVPVTTTDYTPLLIQLGTWTPPAAAQGPGAILHVFIRRPGQSNDNDTYTGPKVGGSVAAANLLVAMANCRARVVNTGAASGAF